MPFEVDHEAVADLLIQCARLQQRRGLDVGCATGRLLRRYANLADRVVGIDPDAVALAEAVGGHPAPGRIRIALVQACAEALPFRSGSFEVLVLGWSL